MTDEGLFFGPRGVRDDVDCIVGGFDQVDLLALAGYSIADFSVVDIDGPGESRRLAAAEEDDVRAGLNDDRVGWEFEVVCPVDELSPNHQPLILTASDPVL